MFFLLAGCNLPFTVLCAVALGSIICSYIIGAEAESLPQTSFAPRPTVIPRPVHFVISNPIEQTASTNTLLEGPSDTFQAQQYLWDSEGGANFGDEIFKPPISRHYTCPPTTLEVLRKRFGARKSLWGEWSPSETRQFYKTQLPKALQIDGALGLSLVERAHLASANRHALRLYARERCHLPSRLAAALYDGLRHLHYFGTWCASGMTWPEVQQKYRREAIRYLGSTASEQEISHFVYRRIVDKACSTSAFFDRMATDGMCTTSAMKLCSIVKKSPSSAVHAVHSENDVHSVDGGSSSDNSADASVDGTRDVCMDTLAYADADTYETQSAPAVRSCPVIYSSVSSVNIGTTSTLTRYGGKMKRIWSAAFNVLLMALSHNLSHHTV